MVEHVDDAGVIVVVCTVRGNVYQYLESQLHVEQSWRGSPSQKIPSDLWKEKINYSLNLIHIPCFKNIVHRILQKCIFNWQVFKLCSHKIYAALHISVEVTHR